MFYNDLFKNVETISPVDAHISFVDGKYEIIPEVYGNSLSDNAFDVFDVVSQWNVFVANID